MTLAFAEKLFSCENSQDQKDFCLFAVFMCLLFAEMFQCENCHAAGSASCLSVLILPKLQLASVRGRSNILSSTRKDPIPPQLLLVFSYTPPQSSSLEVFVTVRLHLSLQIMTLSQYVSSFAKNTRICPPQCSPLRPPPHCNTSWLPEQLRNMRTPFFQGRLNNTQIIINVFKFLKILIPGKIKHSAKK